MGLREFVRRGNKDREYKQFSKDFAIKENREIVQNLERVRRLIEGF